MDKGGVGFASLVSIAESPWFDGYGTSCYKHDLSLHGRGSQGDIARKHGIFTIL